MGLPPTSDEDAQGAATESQSRSRRRKDLHEEALWEARAACQRVLEAAQVLESDIERLSQGLRDVQHACPCGHSSSHPWSQYLDRHPRSPSRHQQERRLTFQEPEVELDPEEGPYRGALGYSSRIFLEDCGGVLPSVQRQETAHPLGRPMAYQDAEGRGNYPSKPSIKDVETWLDWWSLQMDMPYWWAELTAILGWRTQRNLLRKSMPPFQFQQLEARPSWVKGILHPLPPSVSPRMCFSLMTCPIRMFDSSLFS